jgi:hypothetical protein
MTNDEKTPVRKLPDPAQGERRRSPAVVVLAWVLLLGAGVSAGLGWALYGTRFMQENGASAPHVLTEMGPAVRVSFVVVNSGEVATAVLQSLDKTPSVARLRDRPAEVGALVGKGIRAAAAQYAKHGVIVLDSALALGYPKAVDVTPEVTKSVMADLAALAANSPSPAERPASATNPAPVAPESAPENGGADLPGQEGRLP